MKKLLDQNEFLKPLRVGDIIRGSVVGSGRSSLFIDLGIQGTGIVYGKEFYESKERIRDLKTGDELFTKILDLENEDGYIELSIKEANKELSLVELKTQKEKGETITVKVLGANKGGLLAKVSGLPAFLPVSQLTVEHYPRVEKADKNKILQELHKFVGKELKVKIFDLDFKEKKLILSEKARDSEKIKKVLKNYKVGDIVEGEITGIVNFGVFLKFPLLPKTERDKNLSPDLPSNLSTDLSSVASLGKAKEKALEKEEALSKKGVSPKETLEGLIHISELDWQLVDNPSKIVSLGQKAKAKIIEITDDRVSLSLKALKKDPWEGIDEKYKKGDIIKGKVGKFNPFGAFIEIKPSQIQGLVHISEFVSQKNMEELLRIGQDYDFEILQIEPREHKMILKLANQEK